MHPLPIAIAVIIPLSEVPSQSLKQRSEEKGDKII